MNIAISRTSLLAKQIFAAIVTLGLLFVAAPQIAAAQTGKITIRKDAQPDSVQDFSFNGTGPAGWTDSFLLDDDIGVPGGNSPLSESNSYVLPVGVYSFTEGPSPAGWVLTGITCTPASGATVNIASRKVSINLTSTANIICTFINKKTAPATGKITIRKDAQPDSVQDFSFNGTGPAGWTDSFLLDDDIGVPGGNSPLSESNSYVLPVGVYSFTEGPSPAGWVLTGITCTPASGATVNLASRKVSISVTSTTNIICVFANNQQQGPLAQVTIGKNAIPNSTQDFNFSGTGPNFASTATLDDDAGVQGSDNVNSHFQSHMLPSGTYVFTELPNPPGWVLDGISCLPAASAVINLSARTATVTVVGTQPITCMFRNKPVAQACTAYPMQVTVNVYNPMTPFGPQTVNICRGGTVKFVNVSSGATHIINPTVPAGSFTPVSLAVNPASGTTTAFPNVGTYKYLISGFTVQGTIVVH